MEDTINTLAPKGAEIYVVCVETIDPDDPYRFAIDAARSYHVGGKRNLGVLLLLATKSRAYQIVTGSAMEKYLTDAECDHILQIYMVPSLKKGKWGEALMATVDELVNVIGNQAELRDVTDGEADLYESRDQGGTFNETEETDMWWYAIGGVLLTAGFVRWCVHDERKKKKCPQCGKHHLKKTSESVTLDNGITATHTKEACPDCGYLSEQTEPKQGKMCPQCQKHHFQAVAIISKNYRRGLARRYVVQMLCADCGFTKEVKGFKPENAVAMGGVAAERIYSDNRDVLRERDRSSGSSSRSSDSYSARDRSSGSRSRSSDSYSARGRSGGDFSGGGAGGRF